MSCPFNAEQLSQLKAFVQMCQSTPQILHHPSLSFVKDFIVSLGGNIPVATFKPEAPPAQEESPKEEAKPEMEEPSQESETEPEVDLNMEGVIEGDAIDESQIMGDLNKVLTDDEIDQADTFKTDALTHLRNQEYDEAVKLFTKAIEIDPTKSIMFSKRALAYLKLNKPNACIRDCNRALEINCDSAPSYKYRGRAHRLLGQFDDAAADLRTSCKIDFDDEAQEWLIEVTPNAEKIRIHALNVQRRKEEKEHKEKLNRYQKAKEAHTKAKESPKPGAGSGAGAGAGSGAGANFGDAAFNMADQMGLFNDPEIIAAFQDPEVAAAFKDCSTNPANIFKYQNNPKINNIIKKLSSKMGTGSEFPNFAQPGDQKPASAPSNDDVGLD